jgi:hypothetical protein
LPQSSNEPFQGLHHDAAERIPPAFIARYIWKIKEYPMFGSWWPLLVVGAFIFGDWCW